MAKTFPNYLTEKKLFSLGYQKIVGVDEAGRGAMAGPVVAAAVCFPEKVKMIEGVRDSKELTAKQRYQLAKLIKQQAIAWGVAAVPNTIIDSEGIAMATYMAMELAIRLITLPDYLLIDGNIYPKNLAKINGQAIIKGDKFIYSIASASILAKTSRDQIMLLMDKIYPVYDWKYNKGYGTARHFRMMSTYGLSRLHRKSFTFTPK